MKRILFIIALFCVVTAKAQTYLITFAGTGASTTVNSVKVENLTKGTSQTVNGTDILRLTGTVDIPDNEIRQSPEMKIYPNPMIDKSTFEVLPPVAGDAIITVHDISGKLVTHIRSYLENSRQEFKLSGTKNGLYLINVKGSTYQFSGKLLSNGIANGIIKIEKTNNDTKAVVEKPTKTDTKGTLATVDMLYSTGDRLKFTGISENYSTVKIDIPASDKIITFNFIACTDADNNNYTIVEIGPQVWMAENLKTPKYRNGDPIPNVTNTTDWGNLTTGAYCDFNNIPENSTTYGKLYNWYSVNDIRNIAPSGWHVPNDADWTILSDYLTNNGYGYGGSGDDIGKSMASASGWASSGTSGYVGNDQASNNRSGFSALPGGYRLGSGFSSVSDKYGYWWSSTERVPADSWNRYMLFDRINLNRANFLKNTGFSVRCVRD
jgi:uncharacterized protein (TIGR02145 family)